MLILSQVLAGCALAIPSNRYIVFMAACLEVLALIQIFGWNLPPDRLFFSRQTSVSSYVWLMLLSRMDAGLNWQRHSISLSLREQ
jgi:hypothetical protein